MAAPWLAVWLLVLSTPASGQSLAELVQSGQNAEALRALEHADTPALRYLRGRMLERLGRSAEALGDYEDAPAWSDGQRRSGHIQARLGRCTEAAALLTPPRDAPSEALLLECEVRTGHRSDELRARLRALIERDPRGVDTFALRQLLASLVDDPERVLRAAHLAHPTHPDVQLDAHAWTAAERVQIASALLRATRADEAAALLEGTPPRALRAEWLHLRGMSLYRMRTRYDEAARVLRRAARLGGEHADEDAFHAARALSRADEDERAIRAYERFARRRPNHPRAAQARYLAAWLSLRQSASAGRRRMLRVARAGGRYGARAHWELGLAAFIEGQKGRAAEHFRRYAAMQRGAERARGRYWQGRSSRGPRASALFRSVVEEDSLSWYGLLACARLENCSEVPRAEPAPEPLQLTLPPAAREYAALGLFDDAAAALRAAEGTLREQAPRGRVNELRASAYASAGNARRAFQLASREKARLRTRPEGASEWAWNLAYPRPYAQDVARAASSRVPAAFIFAIMRQESGYDPSAFSAAGAAGLLQLMPGVARRHGRRLGVAAERFVPANNIALGAAELGALGERFDGSLPLMAAAYNAGAARVERWLETMAGDLDLFVERIPFDETRRYVRRVLSHTSHYRFREEGRRILLPNQVP